MRTKAQASRGSIMAWAFSFRVTTGNTTRPEPAYGSDAATGSTGKDPRARGGVERHGARRALAPLRSSERARMASPDKP